MEDIFGKITNWKFSTVYSSYDSSSDTLSFSQSEKKKSETEKSEREKVTFTSEHQGEITFTGQTKNAKLFKGILEGENLIFIGEFDGLSFVCGKRKIKNDDIIIEEMGYFEQNYLVFGTMITSFEDCKINFTGKFEKNYLAYGEKKIEGMNFYECGKFSEGKLVYGYENGTLLSLRDNKASLREESNKNEESNKKEVKKDSNPFVFFPPLSDEDNEKDEIEESKPSLPSSSSSNFDEGFDKEKNKEIILNPAYYVDTAGELHLISFNHCQKIDGDGFNDNNRFIGGRLSKYISSSSLSKLDEGDEGNEKNVTTIFEKGIFEGDKLIKGLSVNEKGEKKIIV